MTAPRPINVPVNFMPHGATIQGTTQVQRLRREAVDLAIVTGTVALDLSRSSLYRLTLTADVTISNPTGMTAGDEFILVVIQDATGGRAVTWGNAYNWAVAPDFDHDAASAISVVRGYVVSATEILMDVVRGENTSEADVTIEDITATTATISGALSAGATTLASASVTGALTAATVNGVEILSGTADPTAGGGVAHTLHALYFRNASGTLTLWYATGAAATAWAAVDPLD